MKRLDGILIKKHQGLMNYTIGQRKGKEVLEALKKKVVLGMSLEKI